MGLPITVTTAHRVNQAASSAAAAANWHWLRQAAQMAAVGSGDPLLSESAGRTGPAGPAEPGLTYLPRIATRTPSVDPGSISAARRFATETMRRWGLDDREPDVAVVVSELLTNAVRHGLPLAAHLPERPIRLGLLHAGPAVLCAVADPSERLPVPREPRWLEENGRGLHVIASLSDQWGSCAAPGQGGKVVWAKFQVPSAG
jgi:anti-sigma regulatory factor (Ser/Thr protein kinase)